MVIGRPLAYSTLADLVHHVRQHLPLRDLAAAVAVFSKNVHDESLPTSIQTMSCKLLLNLVECIRTRSDQESGNVSFAPFSLPHFETKGCFCNIPFLQIGEVCIYFVGISGTRFAFRSWRAESFVGEARPAILRRQQTIGEEIELWGALFPVFFFSKLGVYTTSTSLLYIMRRKIKSFDSKRSDVGKTRQVGSLLKAVVRGFELDQFRPLC